jgi:hypothetical protein
LLEKVPKDLKPLFVKRARRARNYYTHDVFIIYEPHDPFRITGQCCRIRKDLKKTRAEPVIVILSIGAQ